MRIRAPCRTLRRISGYAMLVVAFCSFACPLLVRLALLLRGYISFDEADSALCLIFTLLELLYVMFEGRAKSTAWKP